MSQEGLAHRAELHPTYLSGVETDYRNPTVKILDRLARALEIDVQLLLKDVKARS